MILTVYVEFRHGGRWYLARDECHRQIISWQKIHGVLSLYYSHAAPFHKDHLDYVPLTELITWLFNQGIILDWSQVPDRHLPEEVRR